MVKEVKIKGKKYFRCEFCRITYKKRDSAKEHEDSCKKYNVQIKKIERSL